jgi:hypothetical protein
LSNHSRLVPALQDGVGPGRHRDETRGMGQGAVPMFLSRPCRVSENWEPVIHLPSFRRGRTFRGNYTPRGEEVGSRPGGSRDPFGELTSASLPFDSAGASLRANRAGSALPGRRDGGAGPSTALGMNGPALHQGRMPCAPTLGDQRFGVVPRRLRVRRGFGNGHSMAVPLRLACTRSMGERPGGPPLQLGDHPFECLRTGKGRPYIRRPSLPPVCVNLSYIAQPAQAQAQGRRRICGFKQR